MKSHALRAFARVQSGEAVALNLVNIFNTASTALKMFLVGPHNKQGLEANIGHRREMIWSVT